MLEIGNLKFLSNYNFKDLLIMRNLKVLNLTYFTQLTNYILEKLCFCTPLLEKIRLPFNKSLSNKSIEFIQ